MPEHEDQIALKHLLLEAPDGQLDASVFPMIQSWDEPPKAIQILEVLDQCAFGGLASDFVMMTMSIMLQAAIMDEDTTMEDVVAQATWREKLQ